MDRLIRDVRSYQGAKALDFRQRLAEGIILQVGPLLNSFIGWRCPADLQDEVSSKVFVSIVTKTNQFKGETSLQFLAWCFRIARNALTDALRKKQKRESWQFTMEIEELERAVEASANENALAPGERLDLDYGLALLRTAKAPCAELLVDHYLNGLDFEEIAVALNVESDTARMRITRCLETARKLMAKHS